MDLGDRVLDVKLDELYPPHEMREPLKLARLTGKLIAEGWSGRPLLGFKHSEGGVQLLTGTHRVLAAVDAGRRTAPVVLLSASDAQLDDLELLIDGECDDIDILNWLRTCTNDTSAIELMKAEVRSNRRPYRL